MKVVNIGSLNIDKVYSVEHFVAAGETILSNTMETFLGGKGFNQSLALARAGVEVFHAGAIGQDGVELKNTLEASGVKTNHLQVLNTVSGHAVIQLTPKGQNCIIVYGGANSALTKEAIDTTLAGFAPGDILLVQNETSCVGYAIEKAKELGLKVAFNPSPITKELLEYPLHLVDYFLLNEVEGQILSHNDSEDHQQILSALCTRFPNAAIVLTVGKNGVLYKDASTSASHGIYNVPVVDTTGAGDTFCGYFLACIVRGLAPAQALEYASLASSLAVSRKGAGNSIPTWEDVQAFQKKMEGAQ